MAKFQTKAFTGAKPVPQPDDADLCSVVIDVDFPTAALAANDLIELVTLPAGVSVMEYTVSFPDIDSGGAPALAYSMGTEDTAGTDLGVVWDAGITAGQSAAVYRNTSSACAQQVKTSDRKVAIKVTTAAATYAGAGKRGHVILALRG